MQTTIRYILLTALRDWLFIGLYGAMMLAFIISIFLGNTALVEEAQMSLSNVAGSCRIIILIGLITFVCFHVRRAFENREIEVILSRPISRTSFVVAYWLGFAVVSLFLIIPLTLGLFLLPQSNVFGVVYWGLSLMLECFMVIAFALFCSLILRSAVTSVLLCFMFYFIARMMGFFLYVINAPHHFKNFSGGEIIGQIIRFVSSILPRLDLFGQSHWLILGVENHALITLITTQAIIYTPLLLIAALFDFKRKQF